MAKHGKITPGLPSHSHPPAAKKKTSQTRVHYEGRSYQRKKVGGRESQVLHAHLATLPQEPIISSSETLQALKPVKSKPLASRNLHIEQPTADKKEVQPHASKLSFTVASIDDKMRKDWPDFITFIEGSGLLGLLKKTGWSLHATPSGVPAIPVEGRLWRWDHILRSLKKDPTWDGKSIPHSWRFDAQGLHHISMSGWSELIPTSKEPSHPGYWYFDLMTTTDGLNHTWVRLIDEEGNVTSVGMAGEIHWLAMMRGSVGVINCPDHREFSPEAHRSTRIAISQESYEAAFHKIMIDQRDHNLYFNLLSRNCSVYASEIAASIGLHLDNLEFASQIFHRSLLKRIGLNLPHWMLRTTQLITNTTRAILGTIAHLFTGAWYQDATVAKLEASYSSKWENPPKKPFRSWKSFLDGTNFMMRSSFKIAEWQGFVQRYRAQRLACLEKHRPALQRELSKKLTAEAFNKAWENLLLEFSYEMPPSLRKTHLFVSESEVVNLNDIQSRLQIWKDHQLAQV